METAQATEIMPRRSPVIDYLRALLTPLTALFLATVIPSFLSAFRGISSEKATGLAAVAGGVTESIFTPWFLLLFLLLFSVFYFTGGSRNGTVRVVFFWIPASAISVLGLGFWALLVYLALYFRHQ